jgi:iron(II)-dependent oxidoreductase
VSEESTKIYPVPTALQREYLNFSHKVERLSRIAIAVTGVIVLGLITWQLLTREWGVPGKWVSIPAGDFVMGMDEEEAAFAYSMCQEGSLDPSGCFSPEDLLTWSGRQVDASLEAFSVLDNEVSKAQYQQCVKAGGCQAPEDWNYDNKNINNPATKLNWFQASEYCKWLGGRLPTEGEWEKTARGPDGNYFPWGNEWNPSKSNLEHTGIGTVQSITQYAETDISYFGVKNMAGNVQEWTASEYIYVASGQTFANPVLERENTGENWPVIVRGGAWTNARSVGMGSNRGVDSMTNRRDEIGFRCVCPDNNTCETPWDWWWVWRAGG